MPKRTQATKVTDQRGNKPWHKREKPYVYGAVPRKVNRSFLIVCEGQTEAQYFKSFEVLSATVKPVHEGSTKTTLVEAVKRYKKMGDYDEVWCVFDFDYNPLIQGQKDDFNNAIKKAVELGYRCAYSNDAFELWFLLHYQYMDQEHPRTFFFEVLSNRWGINYQKDGKSLKICRGIYLRLKNDPAASQENAINHAKRLHHQHGTKPYHLQNPTTTVYLLVETLNEHCRK